MNKKKIGKFILKLRKSKNKTQEELSNDLLIKYSKDISFDAISQWENGKTIPEIDNLSILADYFSVTIDEILEGEFYNDEDYSEKYYISKENWYSLFDGSKYETEIKKRYPSFEPLYIARQEQLQLVKDRFNELIKIRICRYFTHNEEKEFRFLFENFYSLSEYYKPYINQTENNDYLKLKQAIRKCLKGLTNVDDSEKLWELKKLVYPNSGIFVSFHELSLGAPDFNPFIGKRIDNLDFWEKDLLLTMIQDYDPICIHHDKYGSKHLKDYEEKNARPYDKEQITKDVIKYLIKKGACINRYYLKYIKKEKIETRLIDRIEYLYNLCRKPLLCLIGSGNSIKYYKIENTLRNRFFTKYFGNLNYGLNLSGDKLFEYFIKNEQYPNDLILKAATNKGIEINQEMKYILADLRWSYRIEKWNEYKRNEEEIINGEKELESLISKLEANETTYFNVEKKVIGGNSPSEHESYCYYSNHLITYSELKKMRMEKETKDLLKNINDMSMLEIRKKYFFKEVKEID